MTTTAAPTWRRAVDRLGEAALVGVYVCVASLGVVTAHAGFAAGMQTLRRTDTDPTTATFWRLFRQLLPRTVGVHLICSATLLIGVIDLGFSLQPNTELAGGAGRVPVLAIGVLLTAAAASIWPVSLDQIIHDCTPRAALTQAFWRAAAHPVRSLQLCLLAAATLLAAFVMPAVTPLAVGLYCLVVSPLTAHKPPMVNPTPLAGNAVAHP